MKNLFLTVLFFSFSFCNIFCQLSIGLKSGLSFAKFRYFSDDEHFADSKTINGAEVGVLANIPLKSNFSIQPEINLIQKGEKVVEPSLPAVTKMNQLEFAPLIKFQYSIKKIALFVNSGLFYGYFLNGKSKYLDIERELKFENPSLRRSDFGYLIGGGITWKLGKGSLLFESRYRNSLIYTINAGTVDEKFSVKNKCYGMYIGYMHSLK